MSRERFASLVVALVALGALALAPAAQAAFPGLNGKIAFDAYDGTDQEIYTVSPDGSGLTQLTSNDLNEFEPAFSPDGTRIVFRRVQGISGLTDLVTMNADGTGQTPLAGASGPDAGDFFSPAFTGDASRIIFSNAVGNPQIWAIPAGGGAAQQLSTGVAKGDSEPTSSADSMRIAFHRDFVEGDSRLMVMGPGGGPGSPLTTGSSGREEGPNYSPDVSHLAFSRCEVFMAGCDPSSPMEIVRMPSGGGAITEVTSLGNAMNIDDHDPVFSPDGTLIAFGRVIDSSPAGVFTVASTGGAPQLRTPSLPSAQNPDWQPVPNSTTSCFGRTATIVGTDEKDKLIGTPGDDVFKGLKGRDKIKGKGGDDIACGQRGRDRLFGGRGDDILHGGSGRDFLKGGPGKDQIFGGTRDAKNAGQTVDICVFDEEDKTNNCKVP